MNKNIFGISVVELEDGMVHVEMNIKKEWIAEFLKRGDFKYKPPEKEKEENARKD